jgi:hypothetical protein
MYCLTFVEKNKLRVFDSRVLRRILKQKFELGWRKSGIGDNNVKVVLKEIRLEDVGRIYMDHHWVQRWSL